MISPLPWKLDENDPSIIRDANGEIIADDYKFFHVDDFEAICHLINLGHKKERVKAEKRSSDRLDNLQVMGCY